MEGVNVKLVFDPTVQFLQIFIVTLKASEIICSISMSLTDKSNTSNTKFYMCIFKLQRFHLYPQRAGHTLKHFLQNSLEDKLKSSMC